MVSMAQNRARPFRVDTGGDVLADPVGFESAAVAAEADGYDGMGATETKHDPFVSLALAARATTSIELVSAIAVAFARNPMSMAVLANDIQLVAEGRFVLGLGSQVKPHIERRFSMPWSHPAPRMREFIQAIRAIWTAWETGEKLDFSGEFYSHTLMSPFFDPGPNPFGRPRIAVAAVGELMTEVAGEVGDGWLSHSFTTAGYLRDVSIPALQRGRAKTDAAGLPEISLPVLVAAGRTPAELEVGIAATRKQIAFYGSTPAYFGVWEYLGVPELGEQLNAGSRRGEWDAMATLIDDELLAKFAVIGSPAEIAAQLRERYTGLIDRVSFAASYPVEPALWREVLDRLDAPA